ncbi:SNF2 family N-terminal domain-containing protein [Annulohypoxylon truncatum]|uniref:SNF2 family N-terminal domain-containing protein n=1 Tax=Annulohypoxylon truncatum TaxID=327061 RepID=UPI002007A5B0|nr:SNF2 family N-terminal domain-containing protein [Annulohypoxylon truncatum]KAI1211065.1 SNF2 family N-terminal domain-containing protein [Annulohypoxylon truncatum]
MDENAEGIYARPPTSRIKRSWESINHRSDSSSAAFVDSVKKARISESVNFQHLDVPKVASFKEPVVLPPIHTLGFEYAPSIKPIAPSPPVIRGSYLSSPLANVGYSGYYPPNTLYQEQALINRDLWAQTHEPRQQWALQNKERQSFNSTNNIYADWPVPNLSSFQEPTRYEEQTRWVASGCAQRGHCMALNDITSSVAENNDIDMNNITEDNSCINDPWDGRNAQPENDIYGLVSSSKSPSIFQDMDDDNPVASGKISKETSYDSCFGMIILEDFNAHVGLFNGKATREVSLEVSGGMVIIHEAKSNEYGGLLNRNASRIVSDLVRNYDVELSASMKSPTEIEVLIYGRFEQREAIGDMLLERDCFLQQPESYDVSRPYDNPQCLSNLDGQESFWENNESSPSQSAVLHEKEKSRVVELLDSATGPISFRRVPISDILISKLKEHQIKALSMMTEKESGNICEAEFPSVWSKSSNTKFSNNRFYNHVTQSYTSRTPSVCLGGLLADEMGLGKTLTTLALIATSLNDDNSTLIVCPMTTITCWRDQIERHFRKGSLTYKIYHGSTRGYDVATLKRVNIVLTTYETLRATLPVEDGGRRRSKHCRKLGLLHSINWYRIVLDEAHIVRNRATKTFQAVNTLKARHRWCLTGTPIQNRLEDLGALVEFLKVDPFDDPSTFKNTFLTPISQGEQSGWERLRLLVRSIALRRTKKALDSDLNLPLRYEIDHMVDLDDNEKALYDLVKRNFAMATDSGGPTMKTFQLILRLRQVCNHGSDLLPHSLRSWLHEASAFDAAFPPLQRCEQCDTTIDEEGELSSCLLSCFHQVCRTCLAIDDSLVNSTSPICPLCDGDPFGEGKKANVAWRTTPEFESNSYRPSSKVKALLQNLQNDRQAAVASIQPSAKSVIFSTWTSMLDLIGKALSANAFKYQRLDGSMNLRQRGHALEDFRMNPNCTILLASLGSAAVGLDLTMATRVHLMEPGWNPLLEQQAIDRIHRLGQDREVIATRYIVSGSDSIEQVSSQ